MDAKRFIPALLIGFALLIGGLRTYLTNIKREAASSAHTGTSILDDARVVHSTTPPHMDAGVASASAGRPVSQAGPKASESRKTDSVLEQVERLGIGLASLGERLDDAAVRARSNLDRGGGVHLASAMASLGEGHYEAALSDADRALAKNPDNTIALATRARALVGLERFDEAIDACRQALVLAPGDASSRYNLGTLFYRRSRFSEATEQFRLLLRLDPNHAEGLYNLAGLAQRAGRLAEALECWEAYLRLRPDAPSAWFNEGIVHMDLGRPGKAASCFQQAVALDGRDPDAYVNLGLAYLATGDLEPALDALSAAERLVPCDAAILDHLWAVHSMLADRGGADAAAHAERSAALRAQLDALELESLDPMAVVDEAARGL